MTNPCTLTHKRARSGPRAVRSKQRAWLRTGLFWPSRTRHPDLWTLGPSPWPWLWHQSQSCYPMTMTHWCWLLKVGYQSVGCRCPTICFWTRIVLHVLRPPPLRSRYASSWTYSGRRERRVALLGIYPRTWAHATIGAVWASCAAYWMGRSLARHRIASYLRQKESLSSTFCIFIFTKILN